MHDFLIVSYWPEAKMNRRKRKQTELEAARQALKTKGWSYRTAAEPLQVGWPHLAKVLTGRRQSKRLLDRIHQLPNRTK